MQVWDSTVILIVHNALHSLKPCLNIPILTPESSFPIHSCALLKAIDTPPSSIPLTHITNILGTTYTLRVKQAVSDLLTIQVMSLQKLYSPLLSNFSPLLAMSLECKSVPLWLFFSEILWKYWHECVCPYWLYILVYSEIFNKLVYPMGIKEVLLMAWMVKAIFLIAIPACSEVGFWDLEIG